MTHWIHRFLAALTGAPRAAARTGIAAIALGAATVAGVAFIAVGAGHLIGPDSVQAQLAERGIRSERYE